MQNIFIARQPIYSHRLEVVGYELLFRARDVDWAEIEDGDDASIQVILNSFINIGIESLVGSTLAFINVPEALVRNDALLPVFHEHTVLELLEDMTPTPELLEGLQRLKSRGFALALDDFVYRPECRPLLEAAEYVKIDVLNLSRDEIVEQLNFLMPFDAKLVAEKVETQEKFEECRALGFEYFQGYFFCRPETLTDKTLHANKAVVLGLLQQLSDPELNMGELESTLAADVALSYKLLRYVNSAAFSLRREIDSLKDAIILVGLRTIANWASLILLNSVSAGKPKELIKVGMIRAKMCEILAERHNPQIKSQMFVTGLFSVLDAVMDIPMVELLDNVALAAPIRLALLEHEGDHGVLLKRAVLYEQGRWEELVATGADRELVVDAYLQAVQWADQHISTLFA